MNDPEKSLLVEALDKHWNIYYAKLKLTRREFSREAVDDLRVALRHLLPVIEMLRTIAPEPQLQKFYKTLKDLLDAMEELRDIQVSQVEFSEAINEFPKARPFLTYLEKREDRLLRKMERRVHQLKPGNLIKHASTIRRSIVGLYATRPEITRLLLEAVDDAFILVQNRYEVLDQAKPAGIHRLRVAMRKFRYRLEIVNPVLADFSPEILERLHDLQDSLGYLKDIEILLGYLDEFTSKDPSFGPGPVRRYFQDLHKEAEDALFEHLPDVRSFWYASHSDSFPWHLVQDQSESILPPAVSSPTDTNTYESGTNAQT